MSQNQFTFFGHCICKFDFRVEPAFAVTSNPQLSDWSPENGYDENSNTSQYPLRMFGTSQKNALNLIVSSKRRDIDVVCSGASDEIIIRVTKPGEISPDTITDYFIQYFDNIMITIEAKITDTSDGLRNYELKQRQCFYQSERRLRFFRIYTKFNCDIECFTNYTKQECECVPFYMPSKKCFFSLMF